MSFRCQNCGKAQPAGTRPNQIVTKVREVGEFVIRKEIVEQKNFCASCAYPWQDLVHLLRVGPARSFTP